MVNKSMRCAAQAAQKAAARMSVAACDSALLPTADDTSSAETSFHSAAPVAAGSRGSSPCADDGSPLKLIYYGESGDDSDSKKSVRSPGSP